MSDKIIVDLTDNFAHVGEPIDYLFVCKLDDGLLPYPNARLSKVEAHLTVTFTNPNVLAEGMLNCYVDGYCDRCLAEVSRRIDLPFSQIFYKDVAIEEDGYVYNGSKLDATKAVCDEIALSVPSGLLCKEDCKGLCPKCGTNLNERQCSCDTTRDNALAALKNLKF